MKSHKIPEITINSDGSKSPEDLVNYIYSRLTSMGYVHNLSIA